MDKRTDKNINNFVSSLVSKVPGIRKIYLFGSYAKNLNRRDSDIDLAVIVDDLAGDDAFDLQVQLLLLAAGFDTRIEPHVISTAELGSGDPFVNEVLKTGIEITPYPSEKA